MKKLLVVLFVLSLLSACGPIYSTTYKFIPPKTAKANKCISRCQAIKQSCEQNCSQERRMCRMGNTVLAGVNSTVRGANQVRGRALNTGINNCNFNCGCNSSYRECYASCGGEVIELKQCTAFCGD